MSSEPAGLDVLLEPTSDGSRSRCIARRTLPVGTLVLEGEPTGAVLIESEKGRRCDQCLRTLEGKPLRCSRCLQDAYCSKACQAEAWKRHHRVLCKVLNALAHRLGAAGLLDVERLDAILLARVAVEHFKTEQECRSWEDVEEPLDAPESQLVLSLMQASATATASTFPAILAPLLPAHITEDFLAALLTRFQRNNHALVSPDAQLQPFAHAVLARISRAVNHSCLPSGVVVTTWVAGKPTVGVKIIREVPEGKEVTISYLDPLLARSTRKQSLREIYGFTCACSSCSTPMSRAPPPRLLPLPKTFPPIAGRPSLPQLQRSLPPYPSDRLPAAAPTGLSETTVAKKTQEYEDAHAEGRWTEAGVVGQHVLEIYWVAYGPFTPLIGTHLLSLAAVNLNAAIILPVGDPETLQHLSRSAMLAAWARTVLTVVWGAGDEVEDALRPVEDGLKVELRAM